MNNPSLAPPALIVQKQSCTGDEAEHSIFQLRYHYLILDVAEVKTLKKPLQGNTIKEWSSLESPHEVRKMRYGISVYESSTGCFQQNHKRARSFAHFCCFWCQPQYSVKVHSGVLLLKAFSLHPEGKRTFQWIGNKSSQVELISTLKITFGFLQREAAPESCRLKRAIPVMGSLGSHSTRVC